MKIAEFWNSAFLAALGRLPASEAKKEADVALAICIKHWQEQSEHLLAPVPQVWAEVDITQVPYIRGLNQETS